MGNTANDPLDDDTLSYLLNKKGNASVLRYDCTWCETGAYIEWYLG